MDSKNEWESVLMFICVRLSVLADLISRRHSVEFNSFADLLSSWLSRFLNQNSRRAFQNPVATFSAHLLGVDHHDFMAGVPPSPENKSVSCLWKYEQNTYM